MSDENIDGHALVAALEEARSAHEADPTDDTRAAFLAAEIAVVEARRGAREARNASAPHVGTPFGPDGKVSPVIFDADAAAAHNATNDSPVYGDATTGVSAADLASSKAVADQAALTRRIRRGADQGPAMPATVTGGLN